MTSSTIELDIRLVAMSAFPDLVAIIEEAAVICERFREFDSPRSLDEALVWEGVSRERELLITFQQFRRLDAAMDRFMAVCGVAPAPPERQAPPSEKGQACGAGDHNILCTDSYGQFGATVRTFGAGGPDQGAAAADRSGFAASAVGRVAPATDS